MNNIVWTFEEAVEFCRELREQILPIGFNVGLTGSCLYSGKSSKDIDVILYPMKSPGPWDFKSLRCALQVGGRLKCIKNREEVNGVRGTGYDGKSENPIERDKKWVEVWDYKGKRVDFFFMD